MANKHYDWRFRKRSARMVLDTGRPISAVAKEVGVNPMTSQQMGENPIRT